MKLPIENSRRATETLKFVVSQLDAGTSCLTQGLLTTKGGERVLPVMTNRGRDGGGGGGGGGVGEGGGRGCGFHFQSSGVIQG